MTVPPLRQAAVLAALTLAVFEPTLSSGLVYDARLQILTDPFLHDPRNWPAVLSFAVLGMDVLDFNRPVQLASLMLDAAVWGREPFGYHLTSILLHAANVVLVWLLLSDLLPRGPRGDGRPAPADGPDIAAFAAAVLFAVHPLATEAVCEPTFREDPLVTLFTLTAVVVASRHRPATPDLRRAAVCAACCLLAVGSKESGLVAPLVLAAYWWLFRRAEPPRFWRAAVGGGLAVTAVFLAARFLLEPSPSRIFEAPPVYPGGSLAAALAIEPRILALYAQLIVVPLNLCADYGLYSVRHLQLPAAAVILAVLAVAGIAGARADRRLAFGLALIVLPLLPVLNLVPIYRAAADRYLYLPLAGVAILAGCLVDALWHGRLASRRPTVLAASLVVLLLLGFGSMQRQRVWSNQLALWSDTQARNPESYTAAHGLSDALRVAGRGSEAEACAREALRLSGGERGDDWMALALALESQGREAEADTAADKALAIDPRLATPDARVAVLALEVSDAEEIKRLFGRRAGRKSPPIVPGGASP